MQTFVIPVAEYDVNYKIKPIDEAEKLRIVDVSLSPVGLLDILLSKPIVKPKIKAR